MSNKILDWKKDGDHGFVAFSMMKNYLDFISVDSESPSNIRRVKLIDQIGRDQEDSIIREFLGLQAMAELADLKV